MPAPGRPARTTADLRDLRQLEAETSRQLAQLVASQRLIAEALAAHGEALRRIEAWIGTLPPPGDVRQALDDLADVHGQSAQLIAEYHRIKDGVRTVESLLRTSAREVGRG